MIASGFGAILAVVLLTIALIGLSILALYKWKLALAGLVALVAYLCVDPHHLRLGKRGKPL